MLLDVKQVEKQFNGVYALKDLDFTLQKGEVHGLVGENGAGKSTFIKILGGVYKRDGGSILWDGKEVKKDLAPEESRNLGINIIFQDHVLIPAFTGMENICLGRPYPVKGGLIKWKTMEEETKQKAKELGITLDLKKPVAMMTPAQKKCVEILRAMMNDCRLLILDEPTASLSDKETRLLFSIVRNLKEKGTSVLYVTHRLEEILELTDRVTVLRNGSPISTLDTKKTSREELVLLMSGKSKEDDRAADFQDENSVRDRKNEKIFGEIALKAENIRSKDGIVRGVDLEVRRGCVTGMFGLCGSGRTEFLECIYGTRKMAGGSVTVNGESTNLPRPADSIARGLAMIPEDRRGKAMIPDFTLEENMTLSSMDGFGRHGWFGKKGAAAKANEMIDALKIKCISSTQPAKELSGGNQQKVVFAKALLTNPSVWLCDEPTQAVDVGTRQEIHRLLREEAAKNKAVLYVSSDLNELLEVADSVAVMSHGKVRKTFENRDLKPETVLACCYEAEREENDR